MTTCTSLLPPPAHRHLHRIRRLLDLAMEWLSYYGTPPAKDILIGLVFASGACLLCSSAAVADTIASGNAHSVTPGEVATILGLLLSLLTSAVAFAYSAGHLSQRVAGNTADIREIQSAMRCLPEVRAMVKLLVDGRIKMPGDDEPG